MKREEQWYKVGLKEGLAAADNSRWIAVDKELPPKFGKYMFLLESGDMVYEVYYPNLKLVANVTHWMPIIMPKGGDE